MNTVGTGVRQHLHQKAKVILFAMCFTGLHLTCRTSKLKQKQKMWPFLNVLSNIYF